MWVMERMSPEESRPWYGRVQPFYAPDDIRNQIRSGVYETLSEYSEGLEYTELAEAVAQEAYESFGENAPYKYGDVGIEIARMVHAELKIAPDNRLFIDQDYIHNQRPA